MDGETFNPLVDDIPHCPARKGKGNPELKFADRRPRTGGENSRLEDALFNDAEPQYHLVRERAWHRQAVEMAKTGFNHTEIAEALGLSKQHVSNVLRQPWARERMINEIREEANSEFKKLLEAERCKNLRVLTSIRDDPESTKRDRITAATAIWDRDLGKPNQPFSVAANVDPATLTDSQILEQLAASGATGAGNAQAPEGSQKPDGVGAGE